jgi:hypothetical protein
MRASSASRNSRNSRKIPVVDTNDDELKIITESNNTTGETDGTQHSSISPENPHDSRRNRTVFNEYKAKFKELAKLAKLKSSNSSVIDNKDPGDDPGYDPGYENDSTLRINRKSKPPKRGGKRRTQKKSRRSKTPRRHKKRNHRKTYKP